MAVIETWVRCDLKKTVSVFYPRGEIVNNDVLGNLIGVEVYDDDEPVTLSGSVTGYCVIATGASIPVAGTRSGNKAYIVLPQEAYQVPGPINIVIKLTEGSAVTTLAVVCTTVFGIGSVAADPSQSTIDSWTAQINATIATVQAGAVRFDASQTLTDQQKQTARSNIGVAATVSLISGDQYRVNLP